MKRSTREDRIWNKNKYSITFKFEYSFLVISVNQVFIKVNPYMLFFKYPYKPLPLLSFSHTIKRPTEFPGYPKESIS